MNLGEDLGYGWIKGKGKGGHLGRVIADADSETWVWYLDEKQRWHRYRKIHVRFYHKP